MRNAVGGYSTAKRAVRRELTTGEVKDLKTLEIKERILPDEGDLSSSIALGCK